MRTLRTLFFSLVLTLCSLFAQLSAQSRIQGTVLTEDRDPLALANVLLLDGEDETLIKGQLSKTDGTYEFAGLQPGQYILAINLIGFEDFRYPAFTLTENEETRKFGEQVLKDAATQLEGVTVVAKKPLFEPKIDRLVVNVANTITSAGNTALEILERSPGVIVDRQSNAISISGKSGVVVMINNRINYMSASAVVALLAGMNADNIEKIELITTPPAGLDAEGNAGFINIVLKKNPDDGLSGSYSLSAGYGRQEKGNANINFNYRHGKFNLYGDYGYIRNAQEQSFSVDRSAVVENEIHRTATISLRDPVQRNHNGRLGVDVQLSDRTVFGALFSSYDTRFTMVAANRAIISIDDLPQQFVDISTVERNQWRHYGGNLNLQHTIREGEILTFDADLLYYGNENPADYTNTYLDGNENFDLEEYARSRKITPMLISVGKMDYSRTLGEKAKLATGLKGTLSSFTNDVSVEFLAGQNWLPDPDLTAKYELREKILAAYADLDIKLDDKTSAKIGLRYEYTDSNLGAVENENIVDRQYGRFFPSVFLTRTFNEHNALNLSYSRRITRPTFKDMAPFVIFVDPTSFFSGNPALQPAFSDNIKLDYRLKSTLISLQYSHEAGTISSFQSRIIPGTNNQLIYAENMKDHKTASLTLSTPFSPASWWSMFINASGIWQRAGILYEDILTPVAFTSLNVFSSQTFTLPKDFTLEVTGLYNSGSFFGSFLLKPFGTVNAGLQKKFKGVGSTTLRLGVDNIFNTMDWNMHSEVPELMQTFNATLVTAQPTVILSFSRNFGNRKMKGRRQRDLGSEEERQRIGN